LPSGGTNKFQEIKRRTREAEDKGVKIYRLSIGQPLGPALLSARKAAAEAVMSDNESMHEYQDNGSPGVPDFAQRFVAAHLRTSIKDKKVAYLPTPGSKSMLEIVILSCNLQEGELLGTMTDPGYPTPADQSEYLKVEHYALPTNQKNLFRFNTGDIKQDAKADQSTKLLMLNLPHNPTGQIATRKWLENLCSHCERHGIRLFNDNPYQLLSHTTRSWTLTDVAVNFPNLSWAEAFSASKIIGNGTGWRVGAIVGSEDFVADIATIKSNCDSGFAAPMAAGVLYAIENDRASIEAIQKTCAKRLKLLIDILSRHGIALAIKPWAGFFVLCKVPKVAFGQRIKDAEEFNYLMIENTGVVGVHFGHYIRYSVTGDIEAMEEALDIAFGKAGVMY